MMNILEEEDFIKGLPDKVLMEEAQRPTGTLTQYVVMSEIQRRSKMRKEHEAQLAQGPQSTVKDQIIQEGIMSSMPPQMAMAPQMAQRMPNMPPQGIQQAMPTQMMSGGGIARMANGGVGTINLGNSVLDTSQQMLRGLLVAGVSDAELIQGGYSEEDIALARSGLRDTYNMSGSDNYTGGMREIQSPTRSDPSLVAPSGQRYDPPILDAFNPDGFSNPVRTRRDVRAIPPDRNLNELEQYLEDTFTKPFLGSGIETSGRMGRASQIKDQRGDSFSEGIVSGITNFFGGDDAPKENPNQLVDRLIQERIDLKKFNEGTFDEGIASVGGPFTDNFLLDSEGNPITFEGEFQPTPNDASEPAQREAGKKKPDATRVDIDDATIPSGADAAAGRLSELQAMIDKQSAASSSAAKGAALIALGTSIMEGKTAQGGAKAGEILAKDAQTRGALQLEGAKLRLADAREGEKLQIMRQDLINKLKITDRQSLMAALKSYEASITALTNDRTRLMTEEGQTLMTRLTQEQALLRSLLIPDVDFGGAGTPAPTGFSVNRRG